MPRTVIQDMNASLSFNGTSSVVQLAQTANLPLYKLNTAYTILAWVKPNTYTGVQLNNIFHEGTTVGTSPTFALSYTHDTNRVAVLLRNDAATALINGVSSTTALNKNSWNKVALTDNNGVVKLYINGVEDANSVANAFNYTRTGVFTMTTSSFGAMIRSTTSFYLYGGLSRPRLYKTALTLAQTEEAFAGGEPDYANNVGNYTFNEGSGTVAYDSSGNANNGTITSGTWVSDTPTKKRKQVNGNLVYNGDFEYVPPSATNVATTTATANRGVDGTAGGSTTNNLFGWFTRTGTGSVSYLLDTSVIYSGLSSLKVSTTATGSYAQLQNTNPLTAAGFSSVSLPVLPNTSYTLSFMLKTNLVSGSAATGAQIQYYQRTGTGALDTTQATAGVTTTTDWTLKTVVFTTTSTARFISIIPAVLGNDGAATLIMDAWFDDIELRPTTPVTRTAIQDMNSSLSFNGSSSIVTAVSTGMTYNTGTVIMWVRPDYLWRTNTQAKVLWYTSMGAGGMIGLEWMSGANWFSFITWTGGYVATDNTFLLPAANDNTNWVQIAVSWNGTTGNSTNAKAYFNGVSATVTTANMTASGIGSNLQIGDSTEIGDRYNFDGNISETYVYNRQLTDAEVLEASKNNYPTSGLVRRYTFNEGAGTVAYDSSGNGNNGTITSGTYVIDTPTKKRLQVGGNLVYNGDFEYAPPFTAATTTNQRFIDGTATGSTTNDVFGWFAMSMSGTASAQYDTSVKRNGTASMKLTMSANSAAQAAQSSVTAANVIRYAIPVLPSTSYTVSGFIKTEWISGSATRGAYIRVGQFTGAGAGITSTDTGYFNESVSASDWTPISTSTVITTDATCRFIVVSANVHSTSGATTLNGSAWFDDIRLTPTTNTVRTAVT